MAIVLALVAAVLTIVIMAVMLVSNAAESEAMERTYIKYIAELREELEAARLECRRARVLRYANTGVPDHVTYFMEGCADPITVRRGGLTHKWLEEAVMRDAR